MVACYRSNIPYAKSQPVKVEAPLQRLDALGRRYTPRATSWTDYEEQTLRKMMRDKFTSIDIATRIGRSKKAITAKAHSLGLTFTGARKAA